MRRARFRRRRPIGAATDGDRGRRGLRGNAAAGRAATHTGTPPTSVSLAPHGAPRVLSSFACVPRTLGAQRIAFARSLVSRRPASRSRALHPCSSSPSAFRVIDAPVLFHRRPPPLGVQFFPVGFLCRSRISVSPRWPPFYLVRVQTWTTGRSTASRKQRSIKKRRVAGEHR